MSAKGRLVTPRPRVRRSVEAVPAQTSWRLAQSAAAKCANWSAWAFPKAGRAMARAT